MTEYSELIIPGLRLWLSLGCSPEERAVPQPVDIDVRIKFFQELPGCSSDHLHDVLCYHTLVEHVTASIQHHSCHLIEYLAKRIFTLIEDKFSSILQDALMEISVTKPNPPVPNVQRGITFKYARRVPQKSS